MRSETLSRHHPIWRALREGLQRALALGALLVVCLPAGSLEAAPAPLANLMWSSTGACLERLQGHLEAEAMTPDGRAFQMSIDGQALREQWLLPPRTAAPPDADAREPAAPAPELAAPCEVDDEDQGGSPDEEVDPSELCSKLPEPEATEPEAAQDGPSFVPASLREDILPLEPEEPAMCTDSSENPDRCEPSPPLPQRLTLDAAASGVTWREAARPDHPGDSPRTLPLQAVSPHALLGPSAGWPRAPDQPPQR